MKNHHAHPRHHIGEHILVIHGLHLCPKANAGIYYHEVVEEADMILLQIIAVSTHHKIVVEAI